MSRRKFIAATLRQHAPGLPGLPGLISEDLLEAAHMIDPLDDARTIEVRVLVRVDGDAWTAMGWDGQDRVEVVEAISEMLDDFVEQHGEESANPRRTWITARVPKPAPPGEVDGAVDS